MNAARNLLISLMVLSCAPNPYGNPLPLGTYGELVENKFIVSTPTDKEWAPFVRDSDPQFGPLWVAVSDRGYACIVPRDLYPYLHKGMLLNCEWRRPRIAPALHQQPEWAYFRTEHGYLGRVKLPPTASKNGVTIVVQLLRPDSLVEVSVIELNCHGQLRFLGTTILDHGKMIGKLGGSDWAIIVPGKMADRFQTRFCPKET